MVCFAKKATFCCIARKKGCPTLLPSNPLFRVIYILLSDLAENHLREVVLGRNRLCSALRNNLNTLLLDKTRYGAETVVEAIAQRGEDLRLGENGAKKDKKTKVEENKLSATQLLAMHQNQKY